MMRHKTSEFHELPVFLSCFKCPLKLENTPEGTRMVTERRVRILTFCFKNLSSFLHMRAIYIEKKIREITENGCFQNSGNHLPMGRVEWAGATEEVAAAIPMANERSRLMC